MSIKKNRHIDKSSPLPLYHELKESLAEKIARNEWKPGEKIPSEAELCKEYYVSRITVRKAIEILERSGMLIKYQGKGTFVTNVTMEHELSKFYSFSEEIKQRGMIETVQILSFNVVNASDVAREKLSLNYGDKVIALKRLRMANGMPYTVETSHIPLELCAALTADSIEKNGLYNSMRALGIFPERIVEKLRATAVGKADAVLMDIKPNSPAIELERLTYFGVNAIEFCVSVVRGDFFTYSIELKA
jgi:GntR family transcriptional regulator